MATQRGMKVERICEDLLEFAGKIFSELGGGFPEHVIQNALAIELIEACSDSKDPPALAALATPASFSTPSSFSP